MRPERTTDDARVDRRRTDGGTLGGESSPRAAFRGAEAPGDEREGSLMTDRPGPDSNRPEPGQVQVTPEHYGFERYDDRERWMSYWYQVREALRFRPRTVLEIGPGTGVFRSYLRGLDITVHGCDIDTTRRPDFVGSVAALDCVLPPGTHYDVAVAFQVLEHLPFDQFETCLAQLARTASHVLVSLPHYGWMMRLQVAFFGLRLSRGLQIPFPWERRDDGDPQHFWELGVEWPIRRVTQAMGRHFEILDRYFIPENPYHYMWVLRSRAPGAPAAAPR